MSGLNAPRLDRGNVSQLRGPDTLGVMAAFVDVPRAFLDDVWGRARDAASSRLLPFLREVRTGSNLTLESPNIPANVPRRTSSEAVKGFFDPSSIYTSGYALGVAIMVCSA